jgi:hypothetical protein
LYISGEARQKEDRVVEDSVVIVHAAGNNQEDSQQDYRKRLKHSGLQE